MLYVLHVDEVIGHFWKSLALMIAVNYGHVEQHVQAFNVTLHSILLLLW